MSKRDYSNLLKTSIVMLMAMLVPYSLQAGEEDTARRILFKALDLFQNPKGATMDYEIKLTRFFTQTGSVTLKGEKTYNNTKKSTLWSDGTTTWKLEPGKKTVTVFTTKHMKRRPLGSQLNSVRHNSRYSMSQDAQYYHVHIKSNDSKADIKEAEVQIDRNTFIPSQFRMKAGFVWVTVDIHNFHIKNVPDALFHFNPHAFPGYKLIDKRK